MGINSENWRLDFVETAVVFESAVEFEIAAVVEFGTAAVAFGTAAVAFETVAFEIVVASGIAAEDSQLQFLAASGQS